MNPFYPEVILHAIWVRAAFLLEVSVSEGAAADCREFQWTVEGYSRLQG